MSSPHLYFSDPYELGGLYWIAGLVIGQATSFVAVFLFSREKDASSDLSRDLWVLAGTLEGFFVVFFAVFMSNIKRKYRVTFFSSVSGKQFSHDKFRNATSDAMKIDVFGNHYSYYTDIRGEVEQWVRENYETWVEEKPDWFTSAEASIPRDMIPMSSENDTSLRE